MHRRIPDVSKLQALIGWRPDVGLDGIISDVLDAQRAAAVV
jgi:nucleoside-diphosphate-sugar epimerase